MNIKDFMKNLSRIMLIAFLLAFVENLCSAQIVPVPSDTKVGQKDTKSIEVDKNHNQKKNSGQDQDNSQKAQNSQKVKQVKSARPDMTKAKGARPNITRPSGSGIPKGVGKPGGVGRQGGR
jgi:hypothetical protein